MGIRHFNMGICRFQNLKHRALAHLQVWRGLILEILAVVGKWVPRYLSINLSTQVLGALIFQPTEVGKSGQKWAWTMGIGYTHVHHYLQRILDVSKIAESVMHILNCPVISVHPKKIFSWRSSQIVCNNFILSKKEEK